MADRHPKNPKQGLHGIQFLSHLGSGGYGSVYKIKNKYGQERALKVVPVDHSDEIEFERVIFELELQSKTLHHRTIVPITRWYFDLIKGLPKDIRNDAMTKCVSYNKRESEESNFKRLQDCEIVGFEMDVFEGQNYLLLC